MSSCPSPAFINISPLFLMKATLAPKAAQNCVLVIAKFEIYNQLIVMDAVGFFHIVVRQSSAIQVLIAKTSCAVSFNKASIKLRKVVERKVLLHKQKEKVGKEFRKDWGLVSVRIVVVVDEDCIEWISSYSAELCMKPQNSRNICTRTRPMTIPTPIPFHHHQFTFRNQRTCKEVRERRLGSSLEI